MGSAMTRPRLLADMRAFGFNLNLAPVVDARVRAAVNAQFWRRTFSEDPDAIVAEILAGIDDRSSVTVLPDRAEAIAAAVARAQPGDVVVIAGKGHEQGQEFAGGEKLPFDDRLVARQALQAVRS